MQQHSRLPRGARRTLCAAGRRERAAAAGLARTARLLVGVVPAERTGLALCACRKTPFNVDE